MAKAIEDFVRAIVRDMGPNADCSDSIALDRARDELIDRLFYEPDCPTDEG
jgi:hypothetical protein